MKYNKLQQILQEGEGQYIEFKEKLDNKFPKELVAFVNASGGRIFIGISDSGAIKGINITNELKSKIYDIARNCDPPIHINVENLDNVLLVNVPEGNNKPYQCSDGFYMRIGPNSQKLTRNQILELSIKEGKIRFDEQICEHFNFKDFDNLKFEYYLNLSKISNIINRESILQSLHILTDKGITNAGVLFFAKDHYKYIMTSKIRCVHFKDSERVDILDKKEVDLGIIGNIEFAVNYLKERVPVRFEIKGIKRNEYPQFPEEAYREAIVNAVIHRDYFENGEVAVEKLKNSIIINNPGGLIIPKEDFGKSSRPRNRLLADLVSRTYLMEKVGTGIKRIKQYCKENNNNVKFKFNEHNFFVEIKAQEEGTEQIPAKVLVKVPVKVPVKLTTNQITIIDTISKNANVTIKELSNIVGISERKIRNNISKLKDKQIIRRIGADKNGLWEVIKEI